LVTTLQRESEGSVHQKSALPKADIALAGSLFDLLRDATADGEGVTRESYGPGENAAHAIVREAAESAGLETAVDAAGNLYMTLPGLDRSAPRILIGSHLDSVRCGGNFDGAAGVLAGLSAIAGLAQNNHEPPQDITVMGIRAEESMWFSANYIGSRAALGLLSSEEIAGVRRTDSGRTIAEHMQDCGLDPDAVIAEPPYLRPNSLAAYYEVHIEQGPVLEERAIPVGVVTDIRGNFRCREARCIGEYGHCGTVPRSLRRDAVAAVSELVSRTDDLWDELENQGQDLAVTFGVVATDVTHSAASKVAGEARFTVDVRSKSPVTLSAVRKRLDVFIADIEQRRGVQFWLGPCSETPPAAMDERLRARLMEAAAGLDVAVLEMPSGAGHDALVFAGLGVPAAMLFIRNAHGSHNPHEAMAMDDFSQAASVLTASLVSNVK
jgi:N-carbamoyl-L-amino-acid hydrolase